MVKQKKLSFSWVLVDELMVGSAPRLEDDLKKLESEGIKSILTLCSNEEVDIPEEIHKLFLRESFVLPDHTFRKYPKPDEILEALNILEKIIAEKKNSLDIIKKEKSLNTLEKNIKGQRYFNFKEKIEKNNNVSLIAEIKNVTVRGFS